MTVIHEKSNDAPQPHWVFINLAIESRYLQGQIHGIIADTLRAYEPEDVTRFSVTSNPATKDQFEAAYK